jgi:spermidine synthase
MPNDRPAVSDPAEAPAFLRLVYANAFIVGAVVMGFEMLGSRYLNPYFGSGIYTWAALISTVLAALTAGYFFGGWMADRYPSPRGLGALICFGSAYLALIPLGADALLAVLFDLIDNEKLGSLAGALALLFVPLALLGVYSPYAIRLTLRATERSGTIAGRIYGISTLGSIFGTLFVTFYMIAVLGSRSITYILAGIGFAAGLSFFLAGAARAVSAPSGRRVGAAAAALLLLAGFAAPAAEAQTKPTKDQRDEEFIDHRPDPLQPTRVLERIETEYNNIFIVQRGDFISMTFRLKGENSTQSTVNLRDKGQLPLLHAHYQTLAAAYAGKLDRLLEIGLGGGSVSSYFVRHVPGLSAVSVEIDKGVVDAAKKYFGFAEGPRHRAVVADGRVHLMRDKSRYDVIMVDAFRGGYVPFHMLTVEFYRLLAQRLEPDGVAVMNLRANTELFNSSLLTLKQVFKHVDTFEQSGNVIVLARLAPLAPEALAARAAQRQASFNFRYDLAPMMQDRTGHEPKHGARVLTDDFAPVNLYESRERPDLRRK